MERHEVKQEEIPQERKWQTLGNDGEMAQGISQQAEPWKSHEGFYPGKNRKPLEALLRSTDKQKDIPGKPFSCIQQHQKGTDRMSA